MAYTTIKKSSDYFNTKLFVGNSSTNAITGVGHQPDWTWIKRRDGGAGYSNFLFDAVRGVNKGISSNQTAAEQTFTNGFNSFDSDGFTLGANTSGSTATEINYSGGNYASWNWKANGAGVANTDGSISSTVSASATSGFSIVKLDTGTSGNISFGHGLGVAPKVVIIKTTSGGGNWIVGHDSIGWGKYLNLNNLNAEASDSTVWQNTAPTSSVVTTNSTFIYGTGSTIVAYCFAEKQGFSKFGSYVGNNNTDGTFVYTGFKPAFLMVFAYQAGNENWMLVDNKRDGFNVENEQLFPNTSGAEESNDEVDLLSNGFKLRRANTRMNGSIPYIYMAFAEQPLVGDNPATAR